MVALLLCHCLTVLGVRGVTAWWYHPACSLFLKASCWCSSTFSGMVQSTLLTIGRSPRSTTGGYLCLLSEGWRILCCLCASGVNINGGGDTYCKGHDWLPLLLCILQHAPDKQCRVFLAKFACWKRWEAHLSLYVLCVCLLIPGWLLSAQSRRGQKGLFRWGLLLRMQRVCNAFAACMQTPCMHYMCVYMVKSSVWHSNKQRMFMYVCDGGKRRVILNGITDTRHTQRRRALAPMKKKQQ